MKLNMHTPVWFLRYTNGIPYEVASSPLGERVSGSNWECFTTKQEALAVLELHLTRQMRVVKKQLASIKRSKT